MTSHRSAGLGSRLRARVQRGFTLVEVMIATMVFTMGILGVYAMMIKSYQMVTLSRHRDNGRAVLLSYVDQFLRLSVTDAGVTRGLFVPHAATGLGLSWTDSSGNFVNGDLYDAYPYMPVTLGDSGVSVLGSPLGSQVLAHVSREVTLIDPATGAPVPGMTPTLTAAGYILQAKFTVTFPIAGQNYSESITVARSAR